jgi:hypothetical protein
MSTKFDATAQPDLEALSARISAGESLTARCIVDACLIQPTACKTNALAQMNNGDTAPIIESTVDGCEYNDCDGVTSTFWLRVAARQATGWVKGLCCSYE